MFKHIHKDIMVLQEELSTIKYVLFDDGNLTDEARNRLVKARNTPDSDFIQVDLNKTIVLNTHKTIPV